MHLSVIARVTHSNSEQVSHPTYSKRRVGTGTSELHTVLRTDDGLIRDEGLFHGLNDQPIDQRESVVLPGYSTVFSTTASPGRLSLIWIL
jgi:hypothetical protein